ncbi:MAG: translation initiation factor IF-2 [Pyrinomonadaceae bacterium]
MTAVNKIRIYELAKEVKQEPKRVIEDARKFGIDVSVPSNSVPKEVAEKIREKYDLGKKDLTPKRSIVVIKKQKLDESVVVAAEPGETLIAADATPAPEVVEAPTIVPTSKPVEEVGKPAQRVLRVVTKKAIEAQQQTAVPLVAAPQIETPVITAQTPSKTEPTVAVEAKTIEPPVAEQMEALEEQKVVEEPNLTENSEDKTGAKVFNPSSGVTRLKLNKAGLKAGFRPGERVNIPQPVAPPKPVQPAVVEKKPFERQGERPNRFGGGNFNGGGVQQQQRPDNRPQFRGTPGETATPQTTYTPPANNRNRGRNVKGKQDRHGRDKFAEKDVFIPERLTIEQRLRNQVGTKQDAELKSIRLVEGATVREFAEKLGVAPRDIVQLLIKRGIFATVNQPLNTEIATDLGINFGYQVTFMPFEEMVVEQEFEELLETDSDDVEITRAPVVTVMGHVDHGKTSLLDGIRQANVAGGEAGGITQHIGAYSVFVPTSDNPAENRRVVFLDTPGHEAFTMMRARGAKATDVVVLVVAADDGVMPQTIEAIEHAKAAKVPIVVAINKIDKPDASPDRVKQELTAQGLQPVEWGGETEMVEVSAKKKQNLDTLLETILLTADILDLKASPTRRASGVVLESKLDKGRGPVATVLVQQGTLRVGDPFIVGNYSGKVRAMFSDRGEIVTDAQPATPVEVLGLQGVPQAGDPLQVVVDVDRAQQISNQRLMQARQAALVQTTKRGLESLGQAEFKELLVVLKTDVQGSIEVLRATLEKLSTEKVKVKVIRSGVGAITESDVLLASATQADSAQTAVVIIGFNVRPESRAAEVAKSETVDIRLHSIIYKVEEEIRAAMIGMLDAIEREVILGHALVQEVFKITRVGTIAGCRVLDGIIKRTARARLIRDSVVAWEGEIESLKRVKDDASEVREGFECGIGLRNFNDIKVADQIEAFTIERIAATEL